MNQKGLIHIYTGDGKGKTTAALGLGLRAYGRGFRVRLVQFLKGRDTGELDVLQRLTPNFVVCRTQELKKFVKDLDSGELVRVRAATRQLWEEAVAVAQAGGCDLLILDEVMAALRTGCLGLPPLVAFLTRKPPALEVALTGRDALPELVELADYVSEIKTVKHPYERGIPARRGIEY
ncbi:MAG: cob(I)yrinic acid a,c-diamide adenosyltransferase [Bacillota bacterium]|jgi:cob(I)alamin adenosyltransferase